MNCVERTVAHTRPTLRCLGGRARGRASGRPAAEIERQRCHAVDAGIELKSARKAIESLRSFGGDPASAFIAVDGKQAILLDEDASLDLMRNGQGVFSFVPLKPAVQQINEAVQLSFDDAKAAGQ